MAPFSVAIEKDRLLVVEGSEEQRFWTALLKRLLNRSDIQVLQTGGKSELRSFLLTLVRTRGFSRVQWLGVAQDADDDAAKAWRRIRSALISAGLPAPSAAWTSAVSGRPATAAFVWPDGDRAGDLETLLWDSISPEAAVSCIDAYFTCLSRTVAGLPRQTSKARIHAYLASLEPPHLRMDEAMEAGIMRLQMSAFARLNAVLP